MGKTKIKQIEITDETAAQPAASEKPAETEPEKPAADEKAAAKNSQKTAKDRKVRSRKYRQKVKLLEKGKAYPLAEAVELAKQLSYGRFESALEIHINTSVKNLRGLISLPYLSGKKLVILAFGKGAEDSGADMVGSDETLSEIQKGQINFDVLIATPEWMPKLTKVAPILGPRGLMPNPKNATVTTDLKTTVEKLQSGKIEYKTEKNGQAIHLAVGKVSQPTEEVVQNIKTLLMTIGKSRIKKVFLSPTMGPSVKLNPSSF